MKLRLTISVPNWLDRIVAWPITAYRKRSYGYPFRRIHLTEGKFAIVDPQDFYKFNNFEWCLKEERKCFYAVRFNNRCGKNSTIVSMHRLIMNPTDGLLVDHKNRDGLDNRRENLRIATHSQNECNKLQKKNTSSQFMGVSFDKHRGKWSSSIGFELKKIWLGRFDSEIDAAKAYDATAKKYFGEFARFNFPEESPVS